MRPPLRTRRRRRLHRPNPEWVDNTLGYHWQSIKSAVSDGMMPTQKGGVMEELGCGAYGCVLETGLPSTVLKVTTDKSEAHFAAAAIELASKEGWWPPGMVEYRAAFALPEDTKYQGRNVFLLWREEAFAVGWLGGEGGITDMRTSAMMRRLFGKREKPHERYLELYGEGPVNMFIGALDDFTDTARQVDQDFREEREAGYPLELVVRDLAKSPRLTVLEHLANRISRLEVGSSIGECLGYYLEYGMLLADVHLGNVGEVREPDDPEDWDFVITDPGLMIPLQKRWLSVKLPELR